MPRGPSPEFDEFFVVCSGRLLRTAYLLTGEGAVAEELLQRSLAEAWVAWRRLDTLPEPFVRRRLVERVVGRWPLPSRTPRRRRAVAVLRYVEELAEEETAELVGCSVGTVRSDAARALGDAPAEDLRRALVESAAEVRQVSLRERLAGVERAVAALRRRRRWVGSAASAGGCAALVAAAVLGPALVPAASGPELRLPSRDPMPALRLPPPLAGHRLATALHVGGVTYDYYRSQESPPRGGRLQVTVSASRHPQALAWVSASRQAGRILVSVDGDVVRRGPAGTFQSGLLLSARRSHQVVVRATDPRPSVQLGLAVYR